MIIGLGHYVADVWCPEHSLDITSNPHGTWWHFDDEVVTETGSHHDKGTKTNSGKATKNSKKRGKGAGGGASTKNCVDNDGGVTESAPSSLQHSSGTGNSLRNSGRAEDDSRDEGHL